MAKITYTNKVQSVTNPSPEINKVTAENMNEVKSSINNLYDAFGWERYFDVTNTEVSPQLLIAGIDNVVTIDGATSIVTETPLVTHSALWATNKIKPIISGDCYIIRFDFKAKISNSAGWFEFALNVGGEIGKVLIGNYTFPKGANIEQSFVLTHVIYTASTFIANGAEIIIDPSHTMDIYSKSIFIQRTYVKP